MFQSDDDSEVSSNGPGDQDTHYQKLGPRSRKQLKAILAQAVVTSAVMLSSASCGMPVGYSAILLPQLKYLNKSSGTDMQIDDEIGSWIASIHSAATPLGSLVSGLLMDHCGRKTTLQVAILPLILGWGLIGLAQNHAMLLLGRLIAGMSAGLTAAAGQVLIGETSEPHLRGIFSSVPFASYSFGILLVYALGSILHWRTVAGLSAILPVVSIIVFCFLPESPVWLVRNGKTSRAHSALLWLRGGNANQAKKEVQHLSERNDTESKDLQKKLTILQPEVLKPFILINVFNVLQILSGTYLIVFYAVDILGGIHSTNRGYMAAVLTGCVRFVFAVVASVLLGFLGRRSLAILSGSGTAISSVCLAVILTQNCDSNYFLSAILVGGYVAANTMGFMILPGVMLGELFPAKIRGLAGGLSFMLFNFLLFAVAKMFPLVKSLIGLSGVFWFFGGISLLATLFLYLFLPETKGKSLSDIEDYFKQKGVMWVGRSTSKDKAEPAESQRLNI